MRVERDEKSSSLFFRSTLTLFRSPLHCIYISPLPEKGREERNGTKDKGREGEREVTWEEERGDGMSKLKGERSVTKKEV